MEISEKDIRISIINQLHQHGKNNMVPLLWHGYLAGLFEWGLFDVYTYRALDKLLPPIGYKEIHELFLDEPIKPEREKELDEYFANFEYKIPEQD